MQRNQQVEEEREVTMAAKPNSKPYPFRETPILFGEDALRFLEEAENPVKVSDEERKRVDESYEYIKSIALFPMP